MHWYTGKGDEGETSLFGGERAPKDDPRIEALGDLDEATCAIGLVRASTRCETDKALLLHIQQQLSVLMAEVASPSTGRCSVTVDATMLAHLEEEISRLQARVAPLHDFIFPGATVDSAGYDFARAVVRRAERRVVHLHHLQLLQNPCALRYVNRLSSLLFLLARAEEQGK